MKKLLLGSIVGGALLAILFPHHESLNHTYQTSLWTYPANDQAFTFAKRPPEFCGRWGEQRPIGELIRWNRLTLGFPFRAITIDYQSDHRILQVRGELVFIAVNLGCGASVGFVLFCLLQPRLLRRKQRQAEHVVGGNGG
jgi:hypothetical protein